MKRAGNRVRLSRRRARRKPYSKEADLDQASAGDAPEPGREKGSDGGRRTDPNVTPPADNLASAADKDPGGRMSFFEHLVELRTRLIHSAVAIVICAGIGLLLSKHVITFIVQPMHLALRSAGLGDNLYYTSPAGYVSLVINLGLYLGIAIAMPYVLLSSVAVCGADSSGTSATRWQGSSFLQCFSFCAGWRLPISSCCRRR